MVADALELADDGYSSEEIAAQCNEIICPEAVEEALSFVRQGIVKEVDVQAQTAA